MRRRGAAILALIVLAPNVLDRVSAQSTTARSTAAPDARLAAEFVATIDRSLEDGRVEDYRQLFEPLHEQSFAQRVGWLTTALCDRAWEIESEVRDFNTVGDRAIALVESTFRCRPPEGQTAGPDDVISLVRYVVFSVVDGAPIGLLDADIDATHLPEFPLRDRAHSTFGCIACNYTISATEDWLLVPHHPERSGCLEAVSFHSLRSGVKIDVSIHVAQTAPPPVRVLSSLLKQQPNSGEICEWLPPAYQDVAPSGMSGARADSVIEGAQSSLAAIAFGPVLYLFAINGAAEDCAARAADIDAVLASFMLRETDLGKVQRTLQPVVMHTGGKLDGGRYDNPRYGVHFDGPIGWRAGLRCGGHLFHVTYDCPKTAGRVSLRALAPPPGHRRWSKTTADWSLEFALQAKSLEVKDDSGWQNLGDDAQKGAEQREVVARTVDGKQHRMFRAVLCSDRKRLLILDGRVDAAHAKSLPKLLTGLSWD